MQGMGRNKLRTLRPSVKRRRPNRRVTDAEAGSASGRRRRSRQVTGGGRRPGVRLRAIRPLSIRHRRPRPRRMRDPLERALRKALNDALMQGKDPGEVMQGYRGARRLAGLVDD